jgi:hypothetical protein
MRKMRPALLNSLQDELGLPNRLVHPILLRRIRIERWLLLQFVDGKLAPVPANGSPPANVPQNLDSLPDCPTRCGRSATWPALLKAHSVCSALLFASFIESLRDQLEHMLQ